MSEQIYNPAEIEARWQARWATDRLYEADVDSARPKHYALTMLPYPSGDLHIGHWYAMTPSDAQARFMRELQHQRNAAQRRGVFHRHPFVVSRIFDFHRITRPPLALT